MDAGAKRKSDCLGMNVSTAKWHLYKLVMYNLAKECNRINCHRCGKLIELKDFSLDHKENWLYHTNARELFFDFKNITFSHNKCNVGAKRHNTFKENQTGFKGVSKVARCRTKKYRATISINNKTCHLGHFVTSEEAAAEYDKHVVEVRGDRAITNKSLGLL
jgi:hypothetical protein